MADLAFGHILWKDLISFVLATGRCVSKEQIFLNEKWSYLGGCAVQPNWFQSKFCGRVQTPKTPTITNYRGGVGLRVCEQNLSVFSFESSPGPKVNLSKHNTLIVHCWSGLVPCHGQLFLAQIIGLWITFALCSWMLFLPGEWREEHGRGLGFPKIIQLEMLLAPTEARRSFSEKDISTKILISSATYLVIFIQRRPRCRWLWKALF